MDELVYFTNSQGKRVVLSSPDNKNYWELRGRSGFTAPEVDVLTQRYNTGRMVYFGKILRPRSCSMNMVCVGDTTAKRDRSFFEMLDVLLDAEGDGEGKLYVRRSDGKVVFLNCVYASGMHIVEEYRRFHKFSVEFYAVDPWFYISNVYNITGTGSQIINNNSQENVYPIFHFDYKPNSVTEDRPYISNTTTGDSITFYKNDELVEEGVLFSYENITINSDPKEKAITGDKSQAGQHIYYKNIFIPEIVVDGIESISMSLQPGANTITFLGMMHVSTLEILYRFAGV